MPATGSYIPAIGLGLKSFHLAEALECAVPDLWFEVHPENYFWAPDSQFRQLEQLAALYPLRFHGLAASLASPEPIDRNHLSALVHLQERLQPEEFSEHAVWSSHEDRYFSELLPMPRNESALDALSENIDVLQNALGRQILIENPAQYVFFEDEWPEAEFMSELSKRSGCLLLIDVNNLHVSEFNGGEPASKTLSEIPADAVREIHVAGHKPDEQFPKTLLIDSHDRAVQEPVLALLDVAVTLFPGCPVLIERDGDLPEFQVLLQERRALADRCNANQLP